MRRVCLSTVAGIASLASKIGGGGNSGRIAVFDLDTSFYLIEVGK